MSDPFQIWPILEYPILLPAMHTLLFIQNPELYLMIAVFSLTGYLGINFVLALVKTNGALVAVTGIGWVQWPVQSGFTVTKWYRVGLVAGTGWVQWLGQGGFSDWDRVDSVTGTGWVRWLVQGGFGDWYRMGSGTGWVQWLVRDWFGVGSRVMNCVSSDDDSCGCVVTTFRKTLTVVLSFLLFTKPFTLQ